MKRLVVIMITAFILFYGWLPQVLATTSSSTQTAVYALIKYSLPSVNPSDVIIGNLTSAQITALKASLTKLQGKKFIIFNTTVITIDSSVTFNISNTNDIISMEIVKSGVSLGKAVLTDLTGLNTQNVCNTNEYWFDYLYCSLDNLAKKAPGTAIGDDASLQVFIKGYLDRQFANVGGFDANFEIFAKGQEISVYPKTANHLSGVEGKIPMTFENDPLLYSKDVISGMVISGMNSELQDKNPEVFFVVSDNILEAMSVADINAILAQGVAPANVAAQDTCACCFPPEPTCYASQTGSVIPCNKQIDWVDGFRADVVTTGRPFWNAAIKKFEKLGYTINSICVNQFRDSKDGVDFLKYIIKNINGQVLILGFHGPRAGEPIWGSTLHTDGDIITPIGCVEEQYAGPEGAFEQRLAQDPNFKCLFKQGENPFPFFWKKDFGCQDQLHSPKDPNPPKKYVGWGVRPRALKINQKAIESGFVCHGQLGALQNAHAIFMNPPTLSSSVWSLWDLKLLVSYLGGYGPRKWTLLQGETDGHYDKYPPDFDKKFNLNISHITGTFGGPCELDPSKCTRRWFPPPFYSTVKVTNLEGQSIDAIIPTTWQSVVQISDAHLFPYVLSPVNFNNFPQASTISFSDSLNGPPAIDFTIKDASAIASGPTSTDSTNKNFNFSLVPEVEIVDKGTYDYYLGLNKDTLVPKAMFKISKATAKANNIPMIGNPLAYNTNKDRHYNVEFFPYNQYFMHYNARAVGDDLNTFKENVPYKLHPYVEGITFDAAQLTPLQPIVYIRFSQLVAQYGDACGYVQVDASQCTNRSDIFAVGGKPKFVRRWDSVLDKYIDLVQFTLNGDSDGIVLWNGDVPGSWNSLLKVTVHGVQSYWNHFPLLGNARSSSKRLAVTGRMLDPVWEGNSDGAIDALHTGFPQTPGDFEVLIPCAPKLSACCVGPYGCENLSQSDCKNRGGVLHDGYNCLAYQYYGEPKPNGAIKAMCPIPWRVADDQNCPSQPLFMTTTWTRGPCLDCYDPQDLSSPYCEVSQHAPSTDWWAVGDAYTPPVPYNYNGGLGTPVGQMGCNGGTITWAPGTPVSSCGDIAATGGTFSGGGCDIYCTKTVTNPNICDPKTQFAVDPSTTNGNRICCKLNQTWNPKTGRCEEMFSTACSCPALTQPSPSPTPTPAPSPTPTPAAS